MSATWKPGIFTVSWGLAFLASPNLQFLSPEHLDTAKTSSLLFNSFLLSFLASCPGQLKNQASTQRGKTTEVWTYFSITLLIPKTLAALFCLSGNFKLQMFVPQPHAKSSAGFSAFYLETSSGFPNNSPTANALRT